MDVQESLERRVVDGIKLALVSSKVLLMEVMVDWAEIHHSTINVIGSGVFSRRRLVALSAISTNL